MLYNKLKKLAITEAYQEYYGKPFPHENNGRGKIQASNRLIHGIMHALGCMDLISKIDTLYKEHVPDYTENMLRIAQAFQLSYEDLIKLIEITALFHDSGRQADGPDKWDAESSDNLFNFLIQHKVNPKLAGILRLAIVQKDNPTEYISQATQITNEVDDPEIGQYIDYIRQLINMADTLEVTRVRRVFDCNYLPLKIEKTQNPSKALTDLDALIHSVSARINDEYRAIYPVLKVNRQNGSSFTVQFSNRPDRAKHDQYFEDHHAMQYALSSADTPRLHFFTSKDPLSHRKNSSKKPKDEAASRFSIISAAAAVLAVVSLIALLSDAPILAGILILTTIGLAIMDHCFGCKNSPLSNVSPST
ncbi:MAG: hypothetical protein K0U37_00965 [Gammaproteobacteria bacterium]|nr:hypothetical protein [Gammaproteobacteria bacterium]